MQSVTVQLPDNLYQRIRRRAQDRNRSLADEVAAVIEQAISEESAPASADLPDQLAHLSDADLWAAARLRVPEELSARMQALVWKEQAEGLTPSEQDEAGQIQRYGQHVMLVRAEAAALLRERGYDVSELIDLAGT